MAQMQKSYSRVLAEFCTGLKYEDIPPVVVTKVKEHILDTIGCLLAGGTMDWIKRVSNVAKRMGGKPEATIIGDGAKVGVASAALANGTMGRALDLDDTHLRPWEHMNAYIVPTAFTAGEWLRKSGKDVITAAIAGSEVACRVGLAAFRDKAFLHDPSLGGVENKAAHPAGSLFGTTVEAGKLMGLDVDKLTSAMGFVGSFGLMLMQTHREKAQAMPLNSGWACHAGVVAAMSADTGLKGPEMIFEGDRGYFQAVVGTNPHDLSRLVADLGKVWEAPLGTIKLYPAGHGTHYFLNSVRALMREEGLRAEDVEEINCFVPQMRIEFHFLPREKVYNPGPYDARFSLPFLLATLLVDGNVGVRSFTEEKVKNPKILALAQRIVHTRDEDAWLPENRGYVIVKTKSGKKLERRTPHEKLPGTPEFPAPHEDILAKFRDDASLVLSAKATDKLIQALENLENIKNVADVMRMTVA